MRMSGKYWHILCVIWVTCLAGIYGNVYISVRYGLGAQFNKNISFSFGKFLEFQKCLCERKAVCSATYSAATEPLKVQSISGENVGAANTHPSIFTCVNSGSQTALVCVRSPHHFAPCDQTKDYDFFRIPNTSVCPSTCFGLHWKYLGGSLTTRLSAVVPCDGCGALTSPTPQPLSSTITGSSTSHMSSTNGAAFPVTSTITPAVISTTVHDTATDTSPTSTKTTAINIVSDDSSKSGDDNTGVIAGVVVSLVVVVVLVIIAIFLSRRRKLARKSNSDNHFGAGDTVSQENIVSTNLSDHYTSPDLVQSANSNGNKRKHLPLPTNKAANCQIPASRAGLPDNNLDYGRTEQLSEKTKNDPHETAAVTKRNKAEATAGNDSVYSYAQHGKKSGIERHNVTKDQTVDSNSCTNLDEMYAVVNKGKMTGTKHVCGSCSTVHDYDYACSPYFFSGPTDDPDEELSAGRGYMNTGTTRSDVVSLSTEPLDNSQQSVPATEGFPEYAVVIKKNKLKD